MLDMKGCPPPHLFSDSYIIVGCTIIYLIVPLSLDTWVMWNMDDLEHRSNASEDTASLVAVSAAVFSHHPHTTGPAGGRGLLIVSSRPFSHHPPWKHPPLTILSGYTTLPLLVTHSLPHCPPSTLIPTGFQCLYSLPAAPMIILRLLLQWPLTPAQVLRLIDP